MTLTRAKTEAEKIRDKEIADEVKRHIKAEMLLNNIDNDRLAKRLTDMGYPITSGGLANKISQGKHATIWYWVLMKAIKAE